MPGGAGAQASSLHVYGGGIVRAHTLAQRTIRSRPAFHMTRGRTGPGLHRNPQRSKTLMLARGVFLVELILREPIDRVLEWILIRCSRTKSFRGISVSVFEVGNVQARFSAVEQALALVAELDPRRYRRLCHDLRHVLVMPLKSNSLSMYTGTCYLATESIVGHNDALIACDLVHEATHAHLYRAGLRYWPDLQQRMEELCVREEIAFAELLAPAGFAKTEAFLTYLQELMQTYPRTKGGRLYRWIVNERS